MLNWLLRLLQKVTQFLLNAVHAFKALLKDLNEKTMAKLGAIAIGFGFPPTLGLEFAPDVLTDTLAWGIVKRFAEKISAEMGAAMF